MPEELETRKKRNKKGRDGREADREELVDEGRKRAKRVVLNALSPFGEPDALSSWADAS